MKKTKLWLIVLVSLMGIVASAVAVFRPGHERPSTPPAEMAQRPEQKLRRSSIWARPRLTQADDPTKRDQRLRHETLFMDMAAEANEPAWSLVGATDEEKARLRQSFAEYRTGCARIIERPSEFPSASDDADPSLPWNLYERQLKQILGDERYEKFVAHYRVEHRARQSSRKAAHISRFTQEAAAAAAAAQK